MLYHTSGLPDFEQTGDFAEKYAPGYSKYIREHLKILTGYPSYFAPGTSALYANVNFVLCALIIENVTGIPYPEYIKKEVFEPLDMKCAVVDNESFFIPDRVKGYELQNGKVSEVSKSHNRLLGAGDIVATADDVYRLNIAIKNRLLLKSDTWKEILTPSPVSGMGMGCTVSAWHGKERITHSGGHVGFRTLHIQLPENDFDIIFLSNSGWGNARNDIPEAIYSTFFEKSNGLSDKVEMDVGYI